MKFLKMLGTSALAAAALLAFVGISTATVACKNNANTSECTERWPKGTELKTQLRKGTKARLETSFKIIECGTASATGELTSEGSATSTAQGTGTGTYSECNCEVKVLKTGTLEAHWLSGTDNAEVKSNGAEVTVNCSTIFGNVHCIYVSENNSAGVIFGGSPPIIKFELNVPRLSTNALCDEEARLKAEFEVLSPTPAYAAAG
jgi:hypothetical protein